MPTLTQHDPNMALSWIPRGVIRPVIYNGFCTFYVFYLYLLKKPYEPAWGPTWVQHGPQEGPQNGPNRRLRLTRGLPFSASMLEGLGRPIWERFGTPLGALWGPSWASLGPSWAPLGPTWGHLGPTWGHLGPSWAILGLSWGHLGPIWGAFGAILGPFWVHMGGHYFNFGPLMLRYVVIVVTESR